MKNSTLFLVQSPYNNVNKILDELAHMAKADDHIVMMGDSVLQVTDAVVDTYPNIYCLSNEESLLQDNLKERVNILEYTQFAELVLQFQHCVSLK
jgi:sulfur transfer complex TusBCD TusB component (DsrH family)